MNLSSQDMVKFFLNDPLYSQFNFLNFGTLYTAVYKPHALEVDFIWQGKSITQSINDFKEESLFIEYN